MDFPSDIVGIRSILQNGFTAPLERLRGLVLALLQSKCDEAQVRMTLADAAPLYRGAPETQEARAAGWSIIHGFMDEALPNAAEATRLLAAT